MFRFWRLKEQQLLKRFAIFETLGKNSDLFLRFRQRSRQNFDFYFIAYDRIRIESFVMGKIIELRKIWYGESETS
ncbi:hypothetical protein BpHYR1_045301 [Brachionus plicatilis]|uniref:Uncharacterized protein n=1 Tax=Brachionus plicatilis TaxID=10195 RepID=A0A3M7SNB2_BRAPC|nr:hypothetical protein BpHYR1_045301 [Brachionus plicatilis]